ncbi:uncharacterized mitochondrial protein-like protein [Tanacetum coccineum]
MGESSEFCQKDHPCPKKNMVSREVLMMSGLVSVNNARQVNAAYSKTTVNAARPKSYFFKTSHSIVKRPIYKKTTFKKSNFNQRINTVKDKNVNVARPKAIVNVARPKVVVNVVKGNNVNVVKASACWVRKSKTKVLDHISKYNSASITLKKFDYIDAQGRSKSDQGVIDSGCSRHMTRNMSYLTDYEEIDGGLGHLNFKTMNKLVKGNLVRGLPSKLFENDKTYVACQKGRQHRASYHLDGKADEGFFVGYSLNSKAFRVFNSRTRIVEENLHIRFSESTPNVVGSGLNWLFDIDALTRTMNYKPIVAGIQSNGIADDGFKPSSDDEKKVHEDPRKDSESIDQEKDNNVNNTNNVNAASTNEVNTVSPKTSIELPNYLNMHALEDYSIFDSTSDDQEDGAEADMNNLDTTIQQKKDGIFISQDKYVGEILKKFGFIKVNTASTPMETQKPLLKDEDGEEVDVHMYRYQVNLKVSHLHAVKRIFRYLKGQPKLGLWYPKDSPFDLVAYADSDYAGASLDRKP